MLRLSKGIMGVLIFAWFAGAAVVAAQDGEGSIEGYVVEDVDGDGVCDELTDSGVSGIEVEFESLDITESSTAVSLSDGSFVLETATAGNWDVTVNPGSDWIVTSSQTVQVAVAAEETVTDVIFCVQREDEAASTFAGSGSISGFVYNDVDENGICTDTNEQGQPGIPLQIINRDTNATFNSTSGSGGAYSFGGTSIGTWQVTVNPGSGWRVTSQQTRQVILTAEIASVDAVDFCIVRVPGESQTVLPESGATIAPGLRLMVLLGLFSLLIGVLLLGRARRE